MWQLHKYYYNILYDHNWQVAKYSSRETIWSDCCTYTCTYCDGHTCSVYLAFLYFNRPLRPSAVQIISKSATSQSKATVSVSTVASTVQSDRSSVTVTTVPAMPTTHFSNKPIIINRTTGTSSTKLARHHIWIGCTVHVHVETA